MIRVRTIAPFTLALLAGGPAAAETADRTVLAMGTVLKIHVEATGRAPAEAGAEAALAEVVRIEAACSTWRADSAWSRLNQAGGRALSMAAEWLELLATAQAWSRKTEGSFDPVLGALLEAWDIRGRGRRPGPAELALARTASGASMLHLDAEAGLARLDHPLAAVEEGGFVKGYALDQAMARARAAGVEAGWMDLGGQVLAAGPRVVSVADPVQRDRARVSLRLRDASLATSGTSERGRHILDPRTGRPCPAWGAVAVVRPTALEADILSTALYVMGPVRGLAWAQARRIPACFLHHQGRLRMTREFKALLVP